WRWSVDELESFWSSVAEFFGVRFTVAGEQVLSGLEMPGAKWFAGSRLSYAEHIFAGKPDDAIALHHASELRPPDAWAWAALRRETAAIANGLRKLGVGQGDRVAASMPNIPETG